MEGWECSGHIILISIYSPTEVLEHAVDQANDASVGCNKTRFVCNLCSSELVSETASCSRAPQRGRGRQVMCGTLAKLASGRPIGRPLLE
jgi:hypothetical protein